MAKKQKIKNFIQDGGGLLEQAEYLFLFVILFGALTLFLWNISSVISRGYRERQKFDMIKAEVEIHEKENMELRDEHEYSKSIVAAEEGVRNVLGSSREGEEVVFVDESVLSSNADTGVSDTEFDDSVSGDGVPASYHEQWIDLFFL